MSNRTRILIYVIPVTLISFALNIPKFIEITATSSSDNGTLEVVPTDIRTDPTFIFWYTLSIIWHPTLTTGILPMLGLGYMNVNIFLGIHRSRQISGRRNESRTSETNLAVTLTAVVLMHLFCNVLRVFLGIYLVYLIDIQVNCMKYYGEYTPPMWIMCLESVAHLLIMVNFSSNFLIYCSVSTPFKNTLKTWFRFCFNKEGVYTPDVPNYTLATQVNVSDKKVNDNGTNGDNRNGTCSTTSGSAQNLMELLVTTKIDNHNNPDTIEQAETVDL